VQDRVKAALDVIENVRKSRPAIVSSMEKLSEAYIELAYYDVSQHKNETGKMVHNDIVCILMKVEVLTDYLGANNGSFAS
jgi:hypothetical protein